MRSLNLRWSVIMAVCGLSLNTGLILAETTSGIYFDEAGRNVCLESTSSFPSLVNAFVILKNTEVDSIGGVEFSIWTDSTLTVTNVTLPPHSINVSQFPDFSIGFGRGLEGGERAIVCEISILAFAPGRIFLRNRTVPSIPYASVPVYASMDGSILYHANLEYGAVLAPTAVIGNLDCPIGYHDSINNNTLPPAADPNNVSGTVSMTFRNSAPAGKNVGVPAKYPNEFFDICFRGELIDIDYRCADYGAMGCEGIAVTHFRVNELFWGPQYDIVEVVFKEYQLPNCVRYLTGTSGYNDFSIGGSYVVSAYFTNDSLIGASSYVYRYDSIKGYTSVLRSALYEVGERISIAGQLAHGGMFVEFVDNSTAKPAFPIVATTRRHSMKTSLREQDSVHLNRDGIPLLIVTRESWERGGPLELMAGRHSVFFQRSGEYWTGRGLRFVF